MIKDEILAFANDLSIAFEDVQLNRKRGIDRAFYIQMATELMNKGWRRGSRLNEEVMR